ncbi:MAG: hypothetical protein K2M50_11165 [Treponemataceae bacterium]|nr:hypothetical protein [Treponemataceae bacterium]
MTKSFKIREKEKIKRLVKKMDLEVYRIKISLGQCSSQNVVETMDFLLDRWGRISANRLNVFFKWFLGLVRELRVDVMGDVCEPYLLLLCFADKRKFAEERRLLNKFVFLAWINLNKMDRIPDGICTERIEPDRVDCIIDELLLPWVCIAEGNEELEALLEVYQYNKQVCSRSGIVSRRSLEQSISMDFER